MDIEFNCEHCGQSLTVDESGAGSVVNCPKCSESVLVPGVLAPEAEQPTLATPQNLTLCPDCAREVSMRAATCPHCGAPLSTADPKPQLTASTAPISKPKGGTSVLRIVLMATGAGALLLAALGAFEGYGLWVIIGGVLLILLAAIAK